MTEKQDMNEKSVAIIADGKEIMLTINEVKQFVAKGSKEVTIQECVQFMQMCKFNDLNPWIGDAYLIKYGEEGATMVTSKYAFLKRADAAGDKYQGFKAGIIVKPNDEGDESGEKLYFEYREGAAAMGQDLLGGWAEVHIKDKKYPVRVEVDMAEYIGLKKDGSINKMWKRKPATMIRKVALCGALREAFPNIFKNMISEEELPESPDSGAPVIINAEVSEKTKEPKEKAEGPGQDDDSGSGEETGETKGLKKVRRHRRNEQQIGDDKTIKTAGISGGALVQIKQIESTQEDATKAIDDFLKGIGVQDLTYLNEEEGKDLLNHLLVTLTEEKSERENQGDFAFYKLPCPDRGELEVEISFCEQGCPKSADKSCIHYKE